MHAHSSIKVKDQVGRAESIAHFYRHLEVWPSYDRTKILAPSEVPIQASSSEALLFGGDGRLKLTASLHRKSWVSGQQAYVTIAVKNGTRKTV